MPSAFFLSFLFAVLSVPDARPDPAVVAQAAQTRAPVSGSNGYQALYALPHNDQAVRKTVCPRDTADCLAFARTHEAVYRAALPILQAWDAQVEGLLRYDYFRPREEQYDASGVYPPFMPLLAARSLHALRFINGDTAAAQRGACRDAVLGRRLVHSQGLLLGSMAGTALLQRNIELLAQMRAELPPDAPWPALCDELQPLPPQELALCPLIYGEWLGFRQPIEKDFAASPPETIDDYITLIFAQQMLAQTLHEKMKACAPEALAAVARDEVWLPAPDILPQHCSPANPYCRLVAVDDGLYRLYQARLLNVNRYLRALAILRDPAMPLPAGYRHEGGKLLFSRHPNSDKEQGMQAVVLPLPGSSTP